MPKVHLRAKARLTERYTSRKGSVAEVRRRIELTPVEWWSIWKPHATEIEIFIVKLSLNRFLENSALFLTRIVKHAIPLSLVLLIERLILTCVARRLFTIANKSIFALKLTRELIGIELRLGRFSFRFSRFFGRQQRRRRVFKHKRPPADKSNGLEKCNENRPLKPDARCSPEECCV